MYNGKYILSNDFSGGYCGNLPPTSLELNQATACDNVVIFPDGHGVRQIYGNTKMGAITPFAGYYVGLGYYRKSSATTEYFISITSADGGASTIRYSTNKGVSWSDITGAVSLSSTGGSGRAWTLITFNDTVIGFGSDPNTPDTPFKWTGSGNASLLGGSPPSAYGCFTANNRVFAYRTAANPTTIYWSVIANAEDWTGAGSGSAVAGSVADSQRLTAAAVIDTNTAILFKENSSFIMSLTSAPFPIFTFSSTVGCLGKESAVIVDGTVYFITGQYQMRSTDGENIKEYPRNADDLWVALQTEGLGVRGFRQKGTDYDWIVWVGINGVTNRYAIIWDLIHKCWLRCTTGYRGLTSGVVSNLSNEYYGGFSYGNSAGTFDFVRLADSTSLTIYDAGTTGSGTTITSDWQSGWLNPGSGDDIVQVGRIALLYKTNASATLTLKTGVNFISSSQTYSLTLTATSTEAIASQRQMLTQRGNYFQYYFQMTPGSSAVTQIYGVILGGKVMGQKKFTAS